MEKEKEKTEYRDLGGGCLRGVVSTKIKTTKSSGKAYNTRNSSPVGIYLSPLTDVHGSFRFLYKTDK